MKWKSLGQYRSATLVLFAWILVQLPFGILWVPVEVKWWLAIMPAWIMLVALTTTVYLDTEMKKRIGLAIVSLYVLLAFMIHLTTFFGPQAKIDPDGPRESASVIAASSSSEDLFISANAAALDFYLPYFENRRVISYPLVVMTVGGNAAYVNERIGALIETYSERSAQVFILDCHSEQTVELLSSLDLPSTGDQNQMKLLNWSDDDVVCQITDR